MSGDDIAKIITAVGAAIGAIGGSAAMVIGVINKKAITQTAQKVELANHTIEEVHKQTDGLTRQLVISEKIVSEARGHALGVAQEQVRADALKEGQNQAATEAAKIQTQAAKTQAEAAITQTVAASLQSDAAKAKRLKDAEEK